MFNKMPTAVEVGVSMVGYFNGNDKTLWVMVQGLVQTLLVRLPMAYIMSRELGISMAKLTILHATP